MKILLQIIILIMGLLGLSGCVIGKSENMSSYVSTNFPATYESRVATDLAEALSGLYPPGHTSLYLNRAETEALNLALEQAWRRKGFTIAEKPGGSVKTVFYVLDKLDDGFWYTRLSISGGPVITRAYRENGGRLEALASAKTDQGW